MGKKLDRNRIRELYLQGMSMADVAEEVGAKSVSFVRTILRDEGLIVEYGIDIGKVKALKKAGWSISEIEYELGWKYTAQEIEDALCMSS